MKSKIFLCLAVLCVLAGAPAKLLAGTYSKLDFVGFSRDGKYLAFEEYGIGDASGEPFATLHFVDVEKNALIGKPSTVLIQSETATEEQAITKVERMGAKRMRDLKIVRGNTGRMLVAQLLSDKSREYIPYDGNSLRTNVRFTTSDYPEAPVDVWELTLNMTKETPAACGADEGYDFYKFQLSLDNWKSATEKRFPTRILQKDAQIPESRVCPINYRIERVYIYKNKIAVFLNVFRRGFEGPDMDYMVVTGTMPPESY